MPAAEPPRPARELPALASEIRREVEDAERHWCDAVGHAIKAGELLIEAKSRIGHGGWLPWLAENFTLSERTARNYMRLARESATVADLPTVREAVATLATPRNGAEPDTPDAEVERAEWPLWEARWRRDTNEPSPPRPEGLLDWLAAGPLGLSLSLSGDGLREWHASYVLHCIAPGTRLRTGVCPPAPPSYQGHQRTERGRLAEWDLYVARGVGSLLCHFDDLVESAEPEAGSAIRRNADWRLDRAGARRVLIEEGGAELAEKWSDQEVEDWARGFVASVWLVPTWRAEA